MADRIPAPFQMFAATAKHGPGPKSTPAFANGRLFSMGMTSIVTAYDAATGKQLWQNPAPKTAAAVSHGDVSCC